jgi:hypothetical protein
MIIYGAIGYTILSNNEKKVIIFSDMHDTLNHCDNSIPMSEWLKNKFNTSHILLEEVARQNVNLKEIWPNSEHTQDLKNLFLENSEKIKPVDIRPFLIPFSWEIVNESNESGKIKLYEFLKDIDNFFSLQNKYLIDNFEMYNLDKINNNKIGEYFLKIKKKYYEFISINRELLLMDLAYLLKNYNYLFQQINKFLDK